MQIHTVMQAKRGFDRASPAPALPVDIAAPRILLSPPQLAGEEMRHLSETLGAGWIAPAGPVPRAFEAAIAEVTGLPHVVATSSGTAALHLAFRALGLAPGDEVWTSTLTFIATIAPAIQMGATPRLLDVDPATGLIDIDLLRQELAAAARRGRLPRVVVPVDLYGTPVDMPAMREVCDAWGVAVLSDSAEAMGASRGNRHAGAGARATVFSFNGNKIVTAGGGGALASDDARLIEDARRLANHAKEDGALYQHDTAGYAYGMSSVLAAVGLAQMAVLDIRVQARRAIHARYRAALVDLPGAGFLTEPAGTRSNRWLTVLRTGPKARLHRDTLRRALDALGIETRAVFKPLHLQPMFSGAPIAGGAHATALFQEGLCLPSGSALTREQQTRVINAIRATWPA